MRPVHISQSKRTKRISGKERVNEKVNILCIECINTKSGKIWDLFLLVSDNGLVITTMPNGLVVLRCANVTGMWLHINLRATFRISIEPNYGNTCKKPYYHFILVWLLSNIKKNENKKTVFKICSGPVELRSQLIPMTTSQF